MVTARGRSGLACQKEWKQPDWWRAGNDQQSGQQKAKSLPAGGQTQRSQNALTEWAEHTAVPNEVRRLLISTNTGDWSVLERKRTIINAKQFTRSDANNSEPIMRSFQLLPCGFLPRTLTSTFAFVFPTLPCCFEWAKGCHLNQESVFCLVPTLAAVHMTESCVAIKDSWPQCQWELRWVSPKLMSAICTLNIFTSCLLSLFPFKSWKSAA